MHELSIAQGILDIVRQSVPEPQCGAVASVAVRVGRLSGVVPDSLEFCFEALVNDSPFEHARLAIEIVPVRCVCEQCDTHFEIEDPIFLCPACSSGRVRMQSGMELQVVQIELLDSPSEVP
jgi:hydrogenase nickel incorporation protein HypA/HybF